MTYFCFIESSILTVPHMEPLVAGDLGEAKQEAAALLDQHASGHVAHIFEHEEQVAIVDPPTGSNPAHGHNNH